MRSVQKDVKTPSTRLPTGKRQVSEGSRERAAVARAIKAAIKRIALYDPELAEMLKAEIRSGHLFAHIPKGK